MISIGARIKRLERHARGRSADDDESRARAWQEWLAEYGTEYRQLIRSVFIKSCRPRFDTPRDSVRVRVAELLADMRRCVAAFATGDEPSARGLADEAEAETDWLMELDAQAWCDAVSNPRL